MAENMATTQSRQPDAMDLSEDTASAGTMPPEPKKQKLEVKESGGGEYNLEERLNGILCCAVCLDLPSATFYQCSNGHLMCASCLSHLLADGRIKGESATCPLCRCEISKTLCVRNLAVEKAISEMPTPCSYCKKQLPRNAVADHRKNTCLERPVPCKYVHIGCSWNGPFRMQYIHESSCPFPKKSGLELLEPVHQIREQRDREVRTYKKIVDLLSIEKALFLDIKLMPSRTDDYIPRLHYETLRFSAFDHQWVVRGRVNDNQTNPIHTMTRTLSCQLVLKVKPQAPMMMSFFIFKGPFGETFIEPHTHEFEFTPDLLESPYQMLPLLDSGDCNALLASRHINLRLFMFMN